MRDVSDLACTDNCRVPTPTCKKRTTSPQLTNAVTKPQGPYRVSTVCFEHNKDNHVTSSEFFFASWLPCSFVRRWGDYKSECCALNFKYWRGDQSDVLRRGFSGATRCGGGAAGIAAMGTRDAALIGTSGISSNATAVA